MSHKIGFLIGLVLVLLLSGTVYAQGPEVQHSDPNWQVSYWNNMDLSGPPVEQVVKAEINFDWRTGSPHAAINPDHFSVRWTRYIDLASDTYRFTATSDDGIRVTVDSRLIIDEWSDHPSRTYTADVSLVAGHHLVVVEYYENTGHAMAQLSWAPASVPPDKWQGEYYANRWLSGAPVLMRGDANVDFNWGYGSPVAGIPSNGFSARWTRIVHLPLGLYRFTVGSDDGVRLWVNDHLMIDKWRDQSYASYSGTMHVSGAVSLKMEYYENTGVAAARLNWVRIEDVPPPPRTDIIVDNADPGFTVGGSRRAWQGANEGYGGSLIWTKNNDRARYNYNWARWYPGLEPRRYEVYVHIPEHYATTTSARYWISHHDGFTMRLVSQAANRGRWVSLGTYRFRGTRSDYVSLSDVTYEPYLSRQIAFDAVQWVPK